MIADVGGGYGGEGGRGANRGLALLRFSGLVFTAPQAVALRGRAVSGGRKSARCGPLVGMHLRGQSLLAHAED